MALDGDGHEPAQYDLFVAYARADALWVHGHLLPALGLPRARVITEEQFEPGRFTAAEVERAVRASRHTVLVLSPAIADDQWATYARLLTVHREVAHQRGRLVPLILRPFKLPDGIEGRESIDFTDEARWDESAALLREWLDQPAPVPEEIPCPYPGMIAYTADDAASFFGRDAEIDELVERVRRLPFVYVIGPSGSGKSSLVFAGLLPELQRRERGRWLVRSMRPGPSPPQALAAALGGDTSTPDENPDLVGFVRSLLGADRTDRKLLLVVDQFEELFTLAPAPQREAFIAVVGELWRVPGCVVVLTFRADFYAELMGSPLWPLGPGERFEIVPPRGDTLRQVIELPASQAGVYLEPALVERLVADAAGAPGVLPLMQETLGQLWERRHHKLLTLAAYEALGRDGQSGLAVALARTADACMAKLSRRQHDLTRRILLRLVQHGEGRDDTRRQQSVDALRAANDDRDLFERTLRQLADDRLLTLDGQAGVGTSTVDLAHEALITAWPVLREWTEQGWADELLRRRIEKDAEEWSKNRWDRSGLYRPRRLKTATEWVRRHPYEPSQHVSAFLRASGRLNRAVRTFRVVALASMFLGLAALAVPQVQGYVWREQARILSPMAKFPGGPAVLGSGTRGAWAQQTLTLGVFWLDKHEVSNRQYRLCVQAGRCSEPIGEGTSPSYLEQDRSHPVVFVTARQAIDYCLWLGRRLPSEAEWERAARGTDGRPWPWGTKRISRTRANLQIGTFAPTQLVAVDAKAFADGASPEGVMHLIGNVAEWTATPSKCEPNAYQCARLWGGGQRIRSLDVRGSGFQEPAAPLDQPAEVGAEEVEPNWGQMDIGFRCARSD